MMEDCFPRIWVPSWENRDLRQLLWHRHRMVQARTRILNQLQAIALNEGLLCKKRLWREHGRQQLEWFRLLPGASRGRQDLLELLDRLNPTITELNQAVEQEVEKCPEAQRWMTHPGGGSADGFGLRPHPREGGSVSLRQADCQLCGTGAVREVERELATAGSHHPRGELEVALLAGRSGPSNRPQHPGMAQ
jgi:transposase